MQEPVENFAGWCYDKKSFAAAAGRRLGGLVLQKRG